MEDEIAKNEPKIQADNQSIAIGEINIRGTVTGSYRRAACPCECAPDELDGIVATLGNPLARLGVEETK